MAELEPTTLGIEVLHSIDRAAEAAYRRTF